MSEFHILQSDDGIEIAELELFFCGGSDGSLVGMLNQMRNVYDEFRDGDLFLLGKEVVAKCFGRYDVIPAGVDIYDLEDDQ